jgi:hypothetical protein
MKQTNETPATPTKDPATEVSFLIRSSDDAERLATTLTSYCINNADGEYRSEADELLSLVRHWDAPLTKEAWERISELCREVGEHVRDWANGEEGGWYDLIFNALRHAAKRNGSVLAPSIPGNGGELK